MHLLEIGNTTVKIAAVAVGGNISVERFARADGAWMVRLGADSDAIVCAVTEGNGAERLLDGLDPARLRVLRSPDFQEFVEGSYLMLETLGIDRILNLYGILGDAVVISCGTAITVDAIAGGRPVFGAIASGFSTAAEGFHARVPALPLANIAQIPHLPATTSLESVTNGVLLGAALAAQGLARELARAAFRGTKFRIVLTGGDAPLMQRLWSGPETVEMDDAVLFRGILRKMEGGDSPRYQ